MNAHEALTELVAELTQLASLSKHALAHDGVERTEWLRGLIAGYEHAAVCARGVLNALERRDA